MYFLEIPLAGSPGPSWVCLSALFEASRERVIEPPLTVFKKSGEMCTKLLWYLDITSLRGAATEATVRQPSRGEPCRVLWGVQETEYTVHGTASIVKIERVA